MNLRCLLIDDERPALDLLESFIRRTPGLRIAASFTDPERALSHLNVLQFDVAFLDVDMPGISGLELAEKLPNAKKIVFTTAYRQYAVDAYEKAAADYLLKPFLYQRFLKCIGRLNERQHLPAAYLYFKEAGDGLTVRVALHELMYVSASLNYVELHLNDRKIRVYSGLEYLLKELPSNFTKIHRSYIVNRNCIRMLAGQTIVLDNGTMLPISRSRLAQLKEEIKRGTD
ncbi:LytTR family DNA-binding domain-containing protein [Mucilaginibacter sp. 44-25]|uniref:LytR/AlgR family response regulator transcription factor n=1 Tax=Mucilaginibacter sp. 44-25 TaxID=1895794 RepID=UPI0009629492|nr:LytTR family DNA-binding domain-containing protein [Mucilaginibacter sp. 44-25]OJW17973.1 MAG: hypothetical protein BGO48_15435 [Mucilaginibacter sp. 44-25]